MLSRRSPWPSVALVATTALLSCLPLAAQASRTAPTPQPEVGWRRMVERWLAQEPPEPPNNGGSRPVDGDRICWIAPFAMPETAVVGSDRPTLTWQSPAGAVTQVELRPSDDRHPPLLYPISAANQIRNTPIPVYQLTLDHPLEADVTYEWRMYRPVPSLPNVQEPISRFVRFQVLPPERRDRLTTELARLEQTQTAQGIAGEAATLERAQLFADEQLWSDLWHTLLTQPDPSEALEGAIATTLETACPPPLPE